MLKYILVAAWLLPTNVPAFAASDDAMIVCLDGVIATLQTNSGNAERLAPLEKEARKSHQALCEFAIRGGALREHVRSIGALKSHQADICYDGTMVSTLQGEQDILAGFYAEVEASCAAAHVEIPSKLAHQVCAALNR